ncbi:MULTISPECIES: hypothetical protein [Selenomonas]|uniref:Uncharacterized protein n=1 Tax=Selenomonas flueggei ATCC 43531 TaxID=638302 RepID=C4V539_9FIRM|nr:MULTISPECIES: hypothetical protein [Selenomonas]EEQ48087.1 hypothetical protein HMPREF0908_1633 [Selenomonas flueggei ATCC 43531]
MQTQRIDEKLSFLHTDNHPARQATGQAAGQNTKAAPTILSRAAEVYISAKGRELSAMDAPDDRLTPAETALAAEQNEANEKRAKKDEAAAIEQRIATDEKLTDDDKALLQKEADKLKRAGMTDEDKLSTLYKEKYQMEKQITDGTLTAGEIVNTMRAKDESIANLQNIIKEKAEHTDALRRQSVQERADLDAATAKEKENAAPKEDNATANAVTSLTAALTKKALDDAESKDKDDAGHKDAARSE